MNQLNQNYFLTSTEIPAEEFYSYLILHVCEVGTKQVDNVIEVNKPGDETNSALNLSWGCNCRCGNIGKIHLDEPRLHRINDEPMLWRCDACGGGSLFHPFASSEMILKMTGQPGNGVKIEGRLATVLENSALLRGEGVRTWQQ